MKVFVLAIVCKIIAYIFVMWNNLWMHIWSDFNATHQRVYEYYFWDIHPSIALQFSCWLICLIDMTILRFYAFWLRLKVKLCWVKFFVAKEIWIYMNWNVGEESWPNGQQWVAVQSFLYFWPHRECYGCHGW